MNRFVPPSRVGAKRIAGVCLIIVSVLVLSHLIFSDASGAQLYHRSLQLGNNEISTATDYQLSFSTSTTGFIGSIVLEFCSNDPIPGNPCLAPTGFDARSAGLIDQTGPTGFSIAGASTANRLILTRASAVSPPSAARYHFNNVINPSVPGSYYVRLQTFASSDGSGPAGNYGGIAFAITNSLAVSALVPPYLIFCTALTINGLNCSDMTGDYIDLGELSSHHASSGSSQLLTATNAVDGYSVTVSGTTLTSGNNVINALSGGDVSRPGVGQFGLNLRANSTPPNGADPVGPGVAQPTANYAAPNIYRFGPGETLISHNAPDDVRKYTASYIVNVPSSQAPGVYVTTLTYICLATF